MLPVLAPTITPVTHKTTQISIVQSVSSQMEYGLSFSNFILINLSCHLSKINNDKFTSKRRIIKNEAQN